MNCIFCKIINKEVPADIVYETDNLIVFKDINPKARVHLLIVPKKHMLSVNDVEAKDIDIMGQLIHTAKLIAQKTKTADSGYRLIVNTGSAAGQIVDHLHLHFLAGALEAIER